MHATGFGRCFLAAVLVAAMAGCGDDASGGDAVLEDGGSEAADAGAHADSGYASTDAGDVDGGPGDAAASPGDDAGGASDDAGGSGDDGGGTGGDAGGTAGDASHGDDAGGGALDAGAESDAGRDADDAGATEDGGTPADASAPDLGLLTVLMYGGGNGRVTGNGIDCGSDCTESLLLGSEVTLAAAADADSVFVGWSGAGCSGTGACVTTMTAAVSVAAEFRLTRAPVAITKVGTGSGTVTGAGIDCGSDCSENVLIGDYLQLAAQPAPGSTFDGWSGGSGQCSGVGGCSVLVLAPTNVIASFTAQSYYVDVNGSSYGQVRGPGIDCPYFCRQSFTYGEVVTLTATPKAGATFLNWTGDCSGSGDCTFMVDGYKSVGALFTPKSYTMKVVKSGSGFGLVLSNPPFIYCGAGCTATVEHGREVTLFTEPNAGSTFAGWVGGGCSGTGPCTVKVTGDTTIEAPFSGPTSLLTVTKAGAGAGTVTGTGINCGTDCSESVNTGSSVTLSAAPDSGSRFVGWSGGGCSGTGTCVVTMSASTTVTAVFGLPQFDLSVARVGTGTGKVEGGGISCGSTCTAPQDAGAVVTLTATPAPGSTFDGWSGDCSGTASCAVMMLGARSVTAQFSAPQYPLTVSRQGPGSGRVTSDLSGIDCGVDCSESYSVNTVVTLTAEPAVDSVFGGWGGACSGKSTTCVVTLTAATAVTATFGPPTVQLQISKAGNGKGTIVAPGISCGLDCAEDVSYGTTMNLSATAAADSTFAGWSGACSGAGVICSVLMTAPTNVTANFQLNEYALSVSKVGAGQGTVSSAAAEIDCGAHCSAAIPAGTLVTLTATPSAGSSFVGWDGGGCFGTGSCTVFMSAVTSVTARFEVQQYVLSVTKPGTGSGRVTSAPAGIDCGVDCAEVYPAGRQIELSAAAGLGSVFAGWSGSGCSGTGSCTVSMNAPTGSVVSATFSPQTYTVEVTRSGSYGGTVTGPGINCPGDCTETVAHGTTLTLTATPDGSDTFVGWSGACAGQAACTFTVSGPISVDAAFATKQYALNVSVTKLASATGTVTSVPAGIDCGADCSESYDAGTTVALYARPDVNAVFGGWTGACRGTGACFVTLNQARSVTATFAEHPNVVFVTSTTHTGNLGGLSGADAICQARATAAKLAGTYRAWLSSSSVGAAVRLGNASGWVRPDGLPVFDSRADVIAGRVQYLPVLTETGAELADPLVRTGTWAGEMNRFGTACSDWTAADATQIAAGRPRVSDGQFSSYTTVNCSSPLPIYCFGVDLQGSATVAPNANRRLAFLSSGSFAPPSGGVAAADALCAAEAAAAGHSGSFKALLATDGASGASRFSTSGMPWARTDGVLLAGSSAAVFSGAKWNTGLNRSASGAVSVPNLQVWSGGTGLTVPGVAATTCDNWTAGDKGAAGIAGMSIASEAFGLMSRSCALTSPAVRVYCLQE